MGWGRRRRARGMLLLLLLVKRSMHGSYTQTRLSSGAQRREDLGGRHVHVVCWRRWMGMGGGAGDGQGMLLLLLLLLMLVKRRMHGSYTQTRLSFTCKVHITLEIPLLV